MRDQNMTTFDDADWSEDSYMDECDPGAPLDFVAEASAHRYADFSHGAFVHKLRLQRSAACLMGGRTIGPKQACQS